MSAGMGWDGPADDEPGPARVAASVALLTVLLAGTIAWSWWAPYAPPVVGMCP